MTGKAPRTPLGMRVTEKLLTIFGPPQLGDSTAPHRPVSAEERERDQDLRTQLERVVGPDGHSYLVERQVPAE
ncbi:hypothetical protein QUV83_02885 [Cellulomonas cellasea]|uniref:hypothetical protein n=1 Tax=Cellulomonas TaxID=1707 RepID=UPI000A47A704|nr:MULTISPECIES: hypothetical protein [Cellulomonas]MDM8083709.1 hypothetical protein [Cellulomonas cellasea]